MNETKELQKKMTRIQFVLTKWKFLVLQSNGYHGDGLKWGYLVFPIWIATVGLSISTPLSVSMEEPLGCKSVTAGSSVLHLKLPPTGLRHFGVCFFFFFFLSQLSDHFRHAANPKIVWRSNKDTEAWNWADVKPLCSFFFCQFLRGDSDATCSGSEINSIRSIIHHMNTKPSWINWVGINFNPRHLDSQRMSSTKQ